MRLQPIPLDISGEIFPIGQMPVPHLAQVGEIPAYTNDSARFPIIQAYSPDGQLKDFIFFDNLPFDLGSANGREAASVYSAIFKHGGDIDIAYGLPVKKIDNKWQDGIIEIDKDETKIGLYADSKMFAGFLLVYMGMGTTEKIPEYLRHMKARGEMEHFLQVAKQAEKYLPQPVFHF